MRKSKTQKEEKVDGNPEIGDVFVHNVCGHFSEEQTIWNVLKLKPGHSIIIEAVDNNEYTVAEDKETIYADMIRSNTYFWRPLSNYDGLNPASPDRTKTQEKVYRKLISNKRKIYLDKKNKKEK